MTHNKTYGQFYSIILLTALISESQKIPHPYKPISNPHLRNCANPHAAYML